MAAGLLCCFGTDWENSMLFASEAVMEGVVFRQWGLPSTYRYVSAYIYAPYCNGIRLKCCPILLNASRGGMRCASCAHTSYSRWEKDFFWICTATAVSCCARVFDGLSTLQRIHGSIGGIVCRLDGGIDSVLESEVSNLWAGYGQISAEPSILQIGQ